MEDVFGLLVMLLGVCHGIETSCDTRTNGTQCYGALGGKVELRLLGNNETQFRARWKKPSFVILDIRNATPVINNIRNRSIFTINNGTFRITNLNRNDSGAYMLELLNVGKLMQRREHHLSIQAPVSSVLVNAECLSEGRWNVSCRPAAGDSLQYTWTLDGQPLKDSQIFHGNDTHNTITLSKDVSGQLRCSVRNHISSACKGTRIPKCVFINCTSVNGTQISQWLPEDQESQCFTPTTPPGTTVGKESNNTNSSNTTTPDKPQGNGLWYINHLPLMGGLLAVLLIGLLVGVVCICTQNSKRNKKNPEDAEDDQELTYADVKILSNQRRQKQPRMEMQVEYGEVKVSGRPRQTFETPNDDCTYAKVRRDR